MPSQTCSSRPAHQSPNPNLLLNPSATPERRRRPYARSRRGGRTGGPISQRWRARSGRRGRWRWWSGTTDRACCGSASSSPPPARTTPRSASSGSGRSAPLPISSTLAFHSLPFALRCRGWWWIRHLQRSTPSSCVRSKRLVRLLLLEPCARRWFRSGLGWLVILTRSAMGLVSDCRSAIEEEMWFWEGMSSLATSLKILFWASPNCSEDFCRLPLSINQIPTNSAASRKWSNSGRGSEGGCCIFLWSKLGSAQGAICLIVVLL